MALSASCTDACKQDIIIIRLSLLGLFSFRNTENGSSDCQKSHSEIQVIPGTYASFLEEGKWVNQTLQLTGGFKYMVLILANSFEDRRSCLIPTSDKMIAEDLKEI